MKSRSRNRVVQIIVVQIIFIILGGCHSADTNDKNVADDKNYRPKQAASSTSPPHRRNKVQIIEKNMLEKMSLEMTIEEGKKLPCRLTSGTFLLQERTDESIELSIHLSGTIDKNDGNVMTRCIHDVTIPWDPDSPEKLPYTWVHKKEHSENPGSKAVRDSWKRTHPVIVEFEKNNGNIVGEKTIYPIPGNIDPSNVEFSGQTTILNGSVISFDKLSVFAKGTYTNRDPKGTLIKTVYN